MLPSVAITALAVVAWATPCIAATAPSLQALLATYRCDLVVRADDETGRQAKAVAVMECREEKVRDAAEAWRIAEIEFLAVVAAAERGSKAKRRERGRIAGRRSDRSVLLARPIGAGGRLAKHLRIAREEEALDRRPDALLAGS